MSRVNYLMTAARSKELPEAYSTVYEEVFDLLTTEMLVNPAPITLPRLLPMVEILREKLKNRDLDPDNVVMPPPILPSPSTPTSVFRKQRLDEDPVKLRRLEAEADVCCAKHHLRSVAVHHLFSIQRPKEEYFYRCAYGSKWWCRQGSADSMFFLPRF